ncbi:DUF547 domain-containing protein [Litorimonas sp. RW-G-Af-16]|uniref:DUF547 domain-containing protein n=1 Tax=Litorimonas sp. RW-G-Af-16 TaxID=3241168 RepID=UPI00390C6C7C
MLKVIILSTATVFGSTNALACPDKPLPQTVLAPQVQQVAEVARDAPLLNPPVRDPNPVLDIPEVVSDPIFTEPPNAPAMPALSKPDFTQTAQANPAPTTEPKTEIKTEPKKEPNMAKAKSPANAYEAVLKSRLKPGANGLMVFDYDAAKAAGDLDTISAYVTYLESQDPTAMSDLEATAFWANLYNAVTLRVVLENYPVSSIKKIGGGLFSSGPWKKEIITVNGRAMSLDNVEHDTLRQQYPSPYIHYMVNCASIGCPNLPSELWRAETLETKRIEAARAYINSLRGVKVSGGKLTISSIYDWFQEDFGGSKDGVIAHIREHADAELAGIIDDGAKISGYDYDWKLNAPK